MSLPRKPQKVIVANLSSDYPDDFPEVPEEVVTRFPDMVNWKRDVDKWWENTKRCILRDLDTLSNAIPSGTVGTPTISQSVLDSIAYLQTLCDNLQSAISDLATGPGGSTTTVLFPDHITQSNIIIAGETVTVAANRNMVNAGPYYIVGVLIVSGTAHFI